MPNRSTKVTDQQYQKLYDAVQRDDSAEIEEILKNDGDYLTPASHEGHISVIELLLSQYGFKPNIRDSMGEPLLSRACASGHTKVAQLLIKSGAKLEAKNQSYQTPLLVACSSGHGDTAIMLIDQGVNISVKDQEKSTSLSLACRRGLTEVVKLLISKGASVDVEDCNGFVPLGYAIDGGHSDIAVGLINAGAMKQMADARKTDFFHKACSMGLTPVVELMISKGMANLMDKQNEHVLLFACEGGHGDTAVLLINKGAHLDCSVKYPGRTALHEACRNGLTDVVQSLLDHGADMNETTSNGDSMLSIACNHGHRGVAELLIRRGITVNSKNEIGRTPLLFACENGHTDIAELLIENGASMDVEDSEDYSPLYIACEKGYSDLAILLINRGANVDVVPPRDRDPILMVAVKKGLSKLALALIEKGVDLDLPNKKGDTILIEAIQRKMSDVILAMIHKGADVNVKDWYPGRTALYEACYNGLTDVVQSLLDHGADMNETTSNGDSMLSVACYYGHRGVAELLIRRGITVNSKNQNGQTPLLLACKNGHTDIAELLIENGASMDVKDREGYSPLHISCKYGHSDVALLLLNHGANMGVMPPRVFGHIVQGSFLSLYEGDPILIEAVQRNMSDVVLAMIHKGADVNVKDRWGGTPLYEACFRGLTDVVQSLLDHGADMNETDNNGGSMLSVACFCGHRGVAELLIRRGITVNTKNQNGQTPLLLACQNGHTDIVKLLIENGASMDVEDRDGYSPLYISCKYGHSDVALLLLNHGANVDVVPPREGDPILIEAVQKNMSDVVLAMIRKGADVNVKDREGDPILIEAIQRKMSDVVLAMIHKGADVNVKVWMGNPILIEAIQRKMSDVVLAMIHKGEDLNVKDWRGHDPLYWAKECELHEVVKELSKYSGNSSNTVKQIIGSKSEKSLQEMQTEESREQETQTPDDQQMVPDQPQAEAEKSPPQKEKIDYKPYLSKAIAKKENVTVKRTSLGLVGASGTGKTSILNLLLDKPPVLKHCSTPVLRPLKGIWVIAGVHKWREASPNVLHEVVAGSVSKIAKQDKDKNIRHSNVNGATSSPPSEKRKLDPINANQSDIVEETPISSSPSTKRNVSSNILFDDLPATKEVLSILESQKYEELANLHFVDVVDSGGQAPFIDIAPALFPYTSVNLVALKLNEDLDSEIEFVHSLDGKMISSEKRICTTKQLVAAAFSSKAKIEMPKIEGVEYREFDGPKVMVLGTHYDVYEPEKSSLESLEKKNEQLRHTLQDYESLLIPNGEDIIFPLNALSRGEEAQHIAKKIRQLISHCHIEVPIPVNWYLFHIAIEELKSQKKDIIPISFFYKIGEEHNMEEEEVNSALQYLHDLSVCLYYPNVLPDVVFTSPHYLFEKISNILAVSMGNNEELLLLDMKTREQLKKEGVLKKSMLTRPFSSGFDDDLFSVDQFLELMQHLYIISPLPEADRYFMPCVLEADKEPLKNIPHSAEEPLQPLLLSWKNAVPNGLFPSLVTWLMSKDQQRFKMQRPEKREQYRNNVTLHCPSIACYISLFEYPTFIGVSSTCDPNFLSRCAEVRDTVLEGISCIVKKFNWTASVATPEEAYLCNMSECSLTSYHLSTSDDEYRLISCSVNGCTAVMTNAHLAWYHNRTAGSPNAIYEKRPQCTHVFMLLKDKSTKWNRIGRALEIPFNKREEFDSSGKDDDDCLENVIQHWLETECYTPITWSGLLKLLKSDKLTYIDVARKLEEFLQTDEARKKYL